MCQCSFYLVSLMHLCFLSVDTLNKFFPNLTDTLAEVENQWTEMPSRANMTDNIMRIKDIIERTRELANTVSTDILCCGTFF